MTTTARDALTQFRRLNPDPLRTAAYERELKTAADAEELAERRARKMVALLDNLYVAALAINEAYDETLYNEEQPHEETRAVYPCSIDEWVGNIAELRRAWADKAA